MFRTPKCFSIIRIRISIWTVRTDIVSPDSLLIWRSGTELSLNMMIPLYISGFTHTMSHKGKDKPLVPSFALTGRLQPDLRMGPYLCRPGLMKE